jgi:hypothetical protein
MSPNEFITDLYKGPETPHAFSRDLKDIEVSLDRLFSFDTLLTSIAKKMASNSEFTFVDIGTGAGGALTSLVNPAIVPEFLTLLQQKSIRLKAIGLTDSKSSDLFNQPDPEFKKNVSPHTGQIGGAARVDLEKFFYTVTASQSLESFLQSHQIEQAQFVLASQSILYFSARLFQQTVDTIIDRLAKEGQALIWGVGQHQGPYPAFNGVVASSLRGEIKSQEVADINLFSFTHKGKVPLSIEAPLLTLTSDWDEVDARLEQLVKKFIRQGLVKEEESTTEIKETYLSFLNKRKQPDKYYEAFQKGYGYVEENKAEQAIRYSVLFQKAIDEIKNRQFQRQAVGKQDYIRGLQFRTDVQIEVIKRQTDKAGSRVEAFLITKK